VTVFHQKFDNANVVAVGGNKLTITSDKAGEKRVVDGFVVWASFALAPFGTLDLISFGAQNGQPSE
jgi:hypothetical protein